MVGCASPLSCRRPTSGRRGHRTFRVDEGSRRALVATRRAVVGRVVRMAGDGRAGRRSEGAAAQSGSRRTETELATTHAVAAARSIASSLGLPSRDAIIFQESNRITLRLLPCDVVARVSPAADHVAQFEIELAQRLTAGGSPVAVPDPRVQPRPYEQDGYTVTLWSYYEPSTRTITPADYAATLLRLHAGMRDLRMPTPHFTDRVEQAQRLVADRDRTPDLVDADRELLDSTLRRLRHAVAGRDLAEQILHGEPHPGNLLPTRTGPLFIDLETCCRGPVEFDLAHAPEDIARALSGSRPRPAALLPDAHAGDGHHVALGPGRPASGRTPAGRRVAQPDPSPRLIPRWEPGRASVPGTVDPGMSGRPHPYACRAIGYGVREGSAGRLPVSYEDAEPLDKIRAPPSQFDARLGREICGHLDEGGCMDTSVGVGCRNRQPTRPCLAARVAAPTARGRA